MYIKDLEVGQKVRVEEAGFMFYQRHIGKEGTVLFVDDMYVTVKFDDGTEDFGYPDALRLVNAPEKPKTEPVSVKEAIANVEAALEALKALVG